MFKRFCLFTIFVFMVMGGPAWAGKSHYVPGIEGIKAATLPPEGFYYRMYNVFYNANEYRDNSRNEQSFDASVYCMANRFIYTTSIDVLGADLAFDVIVPVQYSDINTKGPGGHDHHWGLGDILIEPLVLGWHGDRWDALFAAGAWVPTANYQSDRAGNAGKGFWTFMFTAGGTYYFDEAKSWSASVLARYQTNTEREDSDVTYGDIFHFEWGLGKAINQYIEVGGAGYCSWQVTKDHGNGSTSEKEQMYGVGPEVIFNIPDWATSVSLRSLWEFENKNATQGNVTTISITRAF